MKLNKFKYYLPRKFIAQFPATPRDHSKLLVLDKKSGKISHTHFYRIANLLNENDVLVFNNTKVFPARLIGKKSTGGKAEILLLKKLDSLRWEAITKPGFEVGDKVYFKNFQLKITKRVNYISEVTFPKTIKNLPKLLLKIGKTPTPPYIHTSLKEQSLRKKYQTIYATKTGSAAAPTAGFHFTNRLIKNLKNKGVQMEYLTLHIGLGTFEPVKTTNIENHHIHSEYFELNKKAARNLNKAKKDGKRILAVGTTTVRVLETCVNSSTNKLTPKKGETELFIYPPYKFRFTDELITNFHLPKSTLLALVSAFVSYPNTSDKFSSFKTSILGKAYSEAIKKNYRFFSFGDACLII